MLIQFIGYFQEPYLDSEAPIVVCDCIAFLRHHGLQHSGVFRVSPNKSRRVELEELYDKEFLSKKEKDNKEFSILNECFVNFNVNEVASLLKTYLSKLVEPVISFEVQDKLLALDAHYSSSSEGKGKNYVKELSRVIDELKSPFREVLGLLISFLREVSCFHKYNHMNPGNLGTCFFMSIFGDSKNNLDTQQRIAPGISVITDLIKFPVKFDMPRLEVVRKNTKYRKVSSTPIFVKVDKY